QPHHIVFALPGGISLHRRNEILRVLPDQAWNPGPIADAAVAVARGATHGLDVRRAGAVAVFAVELGWLGFGDPAHQRSAERLGLDRMTGQTGLRTQPAGVDEGCVAFDAGRD